MLRKPSYNNPRGGDEYRRLRKVVLKRDKYKCQMPDCGSKKSLQVHHITRYADSHHGRLNADNTITLCRECHEKITGYESHYKALFYKIVDRNSQP